MFHHYQKYFITATTLCLLISLCWCGITVAASDSMSQDSSSVTAVTPVTVLPLVTVTGIRPVQLTGSTLIDSDAVRNLPRQDGSITELLKVAPGVQFSEETNDSFTAGDIMPPEISISGGRTYDNNFMIDGFGNNNLIDPGPELPTLVDSLPGYSQAVFLDAGLVDRIQVYDHNIPARFGGFTGGVVNAETKSPGDSFGGRVFYRRTSDNWTRFHIDTDDRDDFYNSDFYTKQPRFTKQQTGFELSIPLTQSSGLLAGYALNYAEIPLDNLAETVEQTRRSDNYFLKYVNNLDSRQSLAVSALFAPYTESYFLRRTLNSQFELERDNLLLTSSYERTGDYGLLTFDLTARFSEQARVAHDTLATWLSNIDDVPTSKDWGLLHGSNSSKEGGLGDLDSRQLVTSLSVDWLSNPVPLASSSHVINLGYAFDRIDAELEREQYAFAYSRANPITDGTSCIEGDWTCIDGEQYLSRRKTYPIGHERTIVFQHAFYLEDQFDIGDFMLRPAVRISRDTLMRNTDTAPRFAASYKISESWGTTLVTGWNRYYTQNLVAYKLREALFPSFNDDRTSADEAFPAVSTDYAPSRSRFSRLKTPYSDELHVGLQQELLSGIVLLDYVRRDNNDQLAREYVISPDGSYFTLNNNGRGEYESYRISWERKWSTQYLGLNATYEETLSSNEDYDDFYDEDDRLEQVWYKGDLLFPDELPREDFNRPWTANLIYTVQLNARCSFTNTTRYQSEYRAILDTREDTADGYDIYAETKRPSTVTFDWNLVYALPLQAGQILQLEMDLLNVFDKRNRVGTEEDEYSLGRQLWLGMEYRF